LKFIKVIIIGVRVTKVLISKSLEAYGVDMVQNGEQVTVLAKKEVVVSAGTVGSPHLLMLSGIGPKKVLKTAKVRLL